MFRYTLSFKTKKHQTVAVPVQGIRGLGLNESTLQPALAYCEIPGDFVPDKNYCKIKLAFQDHF